MIDYVRLLNKAYEITILCPFVQFSLNIVCRDYWRLRSGRKNNDRVIREVMIFATV